MIRNRFLIVFLTLMLLFDLTANAAISEPFPAGPDCDETFVIVHTNDVHGFIDVEPYVKAVADDLKTVYGSRNVITVSASDVFSGGNAVAHLYNGETIPPIMDAAGYDILVPGNNDLIVGKEELLSLTGMFSHTRTLCANLFNQATDENGEAITDEDGNPVPGESVFDRTLTVETENGVKVGLFGLTIAGLAVGGGFSHMGSADGAREAVGILKAEECTVIVGIGHTGWNDDLVSPSANDITSARLVREVPGIDAYVDAHSHSVINSGSGWICPETGTLVNQASSKGASVGVIRLFIKDGTVVDKIAELLTEEHLNLKSHFTPDPAVRSLVNTAWERLAGDAGEMYLETPYFLNASRASESLDGRSVRSDETNLGDLVADSLRSYADVDVAFAPGVLIRCSIERGKIYTLDLHNVFAIGCYLYREDITGEELLSRIASCLADLPDESASFCQISGASFGYLKECAVSEDGAEIRTIINPMVNGEPLEPGKIYRIASSGPPGKSETPETVISTAEEAVEAMGEYLKSGKAVIFPDVQIPDLRIVPMEEIPAGAVTYEVKVVAPVTVINQK